MTNIVPILVIAGLILGMMILIGAIFAKLYKRASKEVSFVRTGLGGQKVVINGGALTLPVVHETIPVNMNTLRLEVQRSKQQGLITRDRMRVDVQAEFYVRVQPTKEAIADAAQTLGLRTMRPEDLKELIEGKFVDALRSVAAEMAMEELHEKRVDFVQKVQVAVSEDLLKNGLELESVSLTSLDQTNLEHLNPENAFDAQGLTALTRQIETRKKERNEIEQETTIKIEQKNLEAERQKLEVEKEKQEATLTQQQEIAYAKLEHEREIEIKRAAQVAEIAQVRSRQEREAKEAEITAKQQVDQAQIASEKTVEEERIKKDQHINESEIARQRAVEVAAIEKQKAVELSEQDRSIAIAMKSKEQSDARAEADISRAEAVRAEEAVITARETEQANRQKQVELVNATREAERAAIGVTVAAEAEKQAAEDQATALKTLAAGEADKVRIAAEGEAAAEKLLAEAAKIRYATDAAGKKALNEASNLLSAEQIAMQVKATLIDKLPEIIRESARPMERIEGIRIVNVEGLGTTAAAGNGQAPSDNLADQVVNSALRYRAQAPLVESLLTEIGLDGSRINGLTEALNSQSAIESSPPRQSEDAVVSAGSDATAGPAGKAAITTEEPPAGATETCAGGSTDIHGASATEA